MGNPAEVRTVVHVGCEKEIYTKHQSAKIQISEDWPFVINASIALRSLELSPNSLFMDAIFVSRVLHLSSIKEGESISKGYSFCGFY